MCQAASFIYSTIGAIDVQAGILQKHSNTSGTANVTVNGNITINTVFLNIGTDKYYGV